MTNLVDKPIVEKTSGFEMVGKIFYAWALTRVGTWVVRL